MLINKTVSLDNVRGASDPRGLTENTVPEKKYIRAKQRVCDFNRRSLKIDTNNLVNVSSTLNLRERLPILVLESLFSMNREIDVKRMEFYVFSSSKRYVEVPSAQRGNIPVSNK